MNHQRLDDVPDSGGEVNQVPVPQIPAGTVGHVKWLAVEALGAPSGLTR